MLTESLSRISGGVNLRVLVTNAFAILLWLNPFVAFQPYALAQACKGEKLQLTIANIERELDVGNTVVRLHRMEVLEDELFVPQPDSDSADSPFFVYQAEMRRYFLQDSRVAEQVPWGLGLSKYVAISHDGSESYGLAGFKDSEANFQRLMSDYHIPAPHFSSGAQSRALYCARVVFGVEESQWIWNEAEAQMRVKERLSGDNKKDAFAKTDRWWRNFRHEHPKYNVNLSTADSNDRTFTTRIPFFWAPVEGETPPEIRELQIRIDQDGSCHRLTDPTLSSKQ